MLQVQRPHDELAILQPTHRHPKRNSRRRCPAPGCETQLYAFRGSFDIDEATGEVCPHSAPPEDGIKSKSKARHFDECHCAAHSLFFFRPDNCVDAIDQVCCYGCGNAWPFASEADRPAKDHAANCKCSQLTAALQGVALMQFLALACVTTAATTVNNIAVAQKEQVEQGCQLPGERPQTTPQPTHNPPTHTPSETTPDDNVSDQEGSSTMEEDGSTMEEEEYMHSMEDQLEHELYMLPGDIGASHDYDDDTDEAWWDLNMEMCLDEISLEDTSDTESSPPQVKQEQEELVLDGPNTALGTGVGTAQTGVKHESPENMVHLLETATAGPSKPSAPSQINEMKQAADRLQATIGLHAAMFLNPFVSPVESLCVMLAAAHLELHGTPSTPTVAVLSNARDSSEPYIASVVSTRRESPAQLVYDVPLPPEWAPVLNEVNEVGCYVDVTAVAEPQRAQQMLCHGSMAEQSSPWPVYGGQVALLRRKLKLPVSLHEADLSLTMLQPRRRE